MSDAAPHPNDATPRAGLLAQLDAALQDGRDPDFTEILDVIGEGVTIRDRQELRAFQVGLQADDTAIIALRAQRAPSSLTGTGDRERVVVA